MLVAAERGIVLVLLSCSYRAAAGAWKDTGWMCASREEVGGFVHPSLCSRTLRSHLFIRPPC